MAQKITFLIGVFMIVGWLMPNSLHAQNPAPPATFEVFLDLVGNNTLDTSQTTAAVIDPLSMMLSNPDANVNLVFTMLDTTNIDSIHYSFNDIGNSNAVSGTVAFDDYSASGLSYARTGSVVYIGLGLFLSLNDYSATIQFEDSNGNMSLVKTYTTN